MASDDDEEHDETKPQPAASADADPESPPPPSRMSTSATAQQETQVSATGKKTPGTWTPAETVRLIEAYQEKWYALKRGQLRSAHWVEVAEKLASRCRGLAETTSKSYVQCRHKLEKLRRRYRAERHKSSSSNWPFFRHMDRMERGLSSSNSTDRILGHALPFPELENDEEEEEGEEEEEVEVEVEEVEEVEEEEQAEEEEDVEEQEQEQGVEEDEDSDQPPPPPPRVFAMRKRRHHYQNPYVPTNKNGIKQQEGPSKTRATATIMDATSSGGAHRYSREPPASQGSELAFLIHSLGENFLRMEQMKIQMQRENELFRADMELRRTEMVLDLQKQIAGLFTQALHNSKKRKKPEC